MLDSNKCPNMGGMHITNCPAKAQGKDSGQGQMQWSRAKEVSQGQEQCHKLDQRQYNSFIAHYLQNTGMLWNSIVHGKVYSPGQVQMHKSRAKGKDKVVAACQGSRQHKGNN